MESLTSNHRAVVTNSSMGRSSGIGSHITTGDREAATRLTALLPMFLHTVCSPIHIDKWSGKKAWLSAAIDPPNS